MLKKFIKLILISFLTIPLWGNATEGGLKDGIEYTRKVTPLNQIVHVIKIDPTQVNIRAFHALESARGRETLSALARKHKAIAGINGGFFQIGESVDGLPAGILKIDAMWYGIAYRDRGAIGWSNHRPIVLLDRVQTKTRIFLNHAQFPIQGLNRPLTAKKTMLYTAPYGKTVQTLEGGFDFVIENHKITNIKTSGQAMIPEQGYVYSIGPTATAPNTRVTVGDPATVQIEVIPHFLKENYLDWQKVDNIIGGAPLLIYRGRLIHDYSAEKVRKDFISDRYARSAVGTLKNGHWVFVAVEQSALTQSPGMTLHELAEFMKSLNCEYALNLDGGGSSTLYVKNKIVNHPIGDDDEDYGWSTVRPVSDAILILPKS